MRKTLCGALLVLGLGSTSAFDPQAPDSGIFVSPGGSVKIRFLLEEEEHPDSASGQDGYARYEVLFENRKGGMLNRAAFSDIYSWAERAKRSLRLKRVFTGMLWSPKEDFMLFPAENWKQGAGPTTRRALNLNQKNPWNEAIIRFEDYQWLDRFELAGEKSDGCEHSVLLFDGRTGKAKTVFAGGKIAAFGIVNFKTPYLTVKTRLGDCHEAKDEAGFVAECRRWDMKTEKVGRVECR